MAESKPPLQNLLGALMERAMRQRTKVDRHSSGLSRFEAEILQTGALGLQPPQIDGKQPGTGDNGFLSSRSTRCGLAAKNMWKLSKAPPGRVPCLETPDRFHQ